MTENPSASSCQGRVSSAVFAVVLVAVGGILLWWCVYFPYETRLVDLAIPPVWQWASRHEAVAERWEGLVRDPMTHLVWDEVVGEILPFSALQQSAEWQRLADLMMKRRVVLCWTPALPESGESAWILAGWLGWRGALMRAGLLRGLTRGFVRRKAADGGTVWTAPCAGMGWGDHVSMAVREGVIVLALSSDPMAASYSARRIRMRMRPCVAWQPEFADARDEALWRDLSGLPAHGRTVGLSVRGWGERNGVKIRGRADIAGLPPLTLPVAVVQTIPGKDADLRLAVPLGWVQRGLERWIAEGSAAEELLRQSRDWASANAPVFACVWGGERSARWFGIRVPSLVVGCGIQPGISTLHTLTNILSSAARPSGWRVALAQRSTNDVRLVEFRLAPPRSLGLAPAEGSLTVTEAAGWILAANHLPALEEMLASGRSDAEWVDDPETASEAWSLWVEGEAARCVPTLQNGLAVYELARWALGAERSPFTRRWAERLKKRSDCLSRLGRFSLQLRPVAGGTEFSVHFAYDR